MAELRAVQAQKEQILRLVQLKKEALRKTQADLVSSYRELQQTEMNQSERTQNSIFATVTGDE